MSICWFGVPVVLVFIMYGKIYIDRGPAKQNLVSCEEKRFCDLGSEEDLAGVSSTSLQDNCIFAIIIVILCKIDGHFDLEALSGTLAGCRILVLSALALDLQQSGEFSVWIASLFTVFLLAEISASVEIKHTAILWSKACSSLLLSSSAPRRSMLAGVSARGGVGDCGRSGIPGICKA